MRNILEGREGHGSLWIAGCRDSQHEETSCKGVKIWSTPSGQGTEGWQATEAAGTAGCVEGTAWSLKREQEPLHTQWMVPLKYSRRLRASVPPLEKSHRPAERACAPCCTG